MASSQYVPICLKSLLVQHIPARSQYASFSLSPQFAEAECARRALEQLNGFELAGRPMRVGQVTERLDGTTDITFPDGADEPDRTALNLSTAGSQLQLMAKLAEGELSGTNEWLFLVFLFV